MYRNVRKRLEQCGTDVPEEGTVTLYHAGPVAKLIEIERALIIPAVDDDDARRRVYVASSPEIAEVIPHADGAVEVEVNVALKLELGLGDSPDKDWAELVYEVPDDDQGMPVVSARRVQRGPARRDDPRGRAATA